MQVGQYSVLVLCTLCVSTPRGVSSPASLVLCPEGINTKGGSNGHSNHANHMVSVSSLSLSLYT